MLRLANVKKGDVLYDLGSGDGRIAGHRGEEIRHQRGRHRHRPASASARRTRTRRRQRRHQPGGVPPGGPVQGRLQRGHGGHALPAARPQREAAAASCGTSSSPARASSRTSSTWATWKPEKTLELERPHHLLLDRPAQRRRSSRMKLPSRWSSRSPPTSSARGATSASGAWRRRWRCSTARSKPRSAGCRSSSTPTCRRKASRAPNTARPSSARSSARASSTRAWPPKARARASPSPSSACERTPNTVAGPPADRPGAEAGHGHRGGGRAVQGLLRGGARHRRRRGAGRDRRAARRERLAAAGRRPGGGGAGGGRAQPRHLGGADLHLRPQARRLRRASAGGARRRHPRGTRLRQPPR